MGARVRVMGTLYCETCEKYDCVHVSEVNGLCRDVCMFDEQHAKKVAEEKRALSGWRGRRLMACRSMDDLAKVCEHLGEHGQADDGLPYVGDAPAHVRPDTGLPWVTDQQKRELANMGALYLRMILTLNDGHVSRQELRRF